MPDKHCTHSLFNTGVHRLTYFETTDWRGLLEQAKIDRARGRFPRLPEALFPLYHVFCRLGPLPLAQEEFCAWLCSFPGKSATLKDSKAERRLPPSEIISQDGGKEVNRGFVDQCDPLFFASYESDQERAR